MSEFISKEHYENFANLFCAVTICSCDYYKKYLPVAQILFENFVENFEKYFKSVSSNQHNLVHVVDEVRRFGTLNTFSSYPFESHLFQIKKLVRSGRLPLNQIINRITEKQLQKSCAEGYLKYPVLENPSTEDATTFLRIVISDGFTLQNSFPDKWFLTTNSKVVAMVHVNLNGIMGKELKQTFIQFKSPLKSFDRNVMCTYNDNSFIPCKLYPLTEIFCKLVAIPIKEKTVFVPLHHTLPT